MRQKSTLINVHLCNLDMAFWHSPRGICCNSAIELGVCWVTHIRKINGMALSTIKIIDSKSRKLLLILDIDQQALDYWHENLAKKIFKIANLT